MAQLNTTVDNIQLKENMITSAVAAAEWDTDAKYPSAAAVKNAIATAAGTAVCDIANAVGSVVITSTNSNPGSTLGGTWELIDKEFKNNSMYLGDSGGVVGSWEAQGASFYDGYATRTSHMIRVKLDVNTTSDLSTGSTSATRTLGKLTANKVGYTSLEFNRRDTRITQAVDTNGTVYTLEYVIYSNGTIEISRIFGGVTIPKGTTININTLRMANITNTTIPQGLL